MTTCTICGNEFTPRKKAANQSPQHLCGVECRAQWVAQMNRRLPPRLSRDVACAKCGNLTPSRGPGRTYCFDCRMPERMCAECGKPFRYLASSPRTFCSRRCAGLATGRGKPAGRDSWSWTGGAPGYRGPGWAALSEQIRDRDGRRCVDCGTAETASAPLHVHHLIRAAEWDRPGEANDPVNLVSVCRWCHQKRHALDPDVKKEHDRARRKASYQAHRAEAIAAATAWNRANADRRRAAYHARKRDGA